VQVLVLLAFFSGCAPGTREEPPPNIVLILLDTVGSNHIATYGYARHDPGDRRPRT
jgi:hypothetical protein